MNRTLRPNRSFLLALCGLVLVGGLPRAGCICPSGEVCVVCFGNANCAAPNNELAAPPCACGCRDSLPEAARNAHGPEAPSLERSPCIRLVTQLSLSHDARKTFECRPPSVCWIAGRAEKPGTNLAVDFLAGRIADRLPPDDPVSRAQILRL